MPQLIVKLQLRTTGSGLSEDAEGMQVAPEHRWEHPQDALVESVTSFIFFSYVSKYEEIRV